MISNCSISRELTAQACLRSFLLLLFWIFSNLCLAQMNAESRSSKHHATARPTLGTGAAFAPNGDLWIAGVEQGRLFLQTTPNNAESWLPKRWIDTGNDKIAAEGELRPKLAFGLNGQVVIAYTQPLAKPYTGEIRMLRSSDGGQTFSLPFTVHQDRQPITHRFESILFDQAGNLYVTWIDKRAQELAKQTGKTDYRGAAIYYTVSKDGGASFADDRKLADYSCECCRIALSENAQGQVAALWRHVFLSSTGEQIRDHGFAYLPLSGDVESDKQPARATFDDWQLNACPHHGPGLAAYSAGFHAVWFGMKAGKMGVRYGRLNVRGEPSSEPLNLPDERAEHADVQAIGERVAIVWRSFDGQQSNLRVWISDDAGCHFVLKTLASSVDENDHPRLVSNQRGAWVVWRTEKVIHVYQIL